MKYLRLSFICAATPTQSAEQSYMRISNSSWWSCFAWSCGLKFLKTSTGVSKLLAFLGHTGRRVGLGDSLNTFWHVTTKKCHNVLSKCMILGWATFTAILGHTWPEGCGSAAGAWCWKSHQCCRSLPSDSAGTRIQDPFLLPCLSSALYQQSVTLCQLARKSV